MKNNKWRENPSPLQELGKWNHKIIGSWYREICPCSRNKKSTQICLAASPRPTGNVEAAYKISKHQLQNTKQSYQPQWGTSKPQAGNTCVMERISGLSLWHKETSLWSIGEESSPTRIPKERAASLGDQTTKGYTTQALNPNHLKLWRPKEGVSPALAPLKPICL